MADPIRFPCTNRDWIIDINAAAQLAGLSRRTIEYHLGHECEFPRPLKPADAAAAVTAHPQLRESFAELFRRAGGGRGPMALFLQSQVTAWKCLQAAKGRR